MAAIGTTTAQNTGVGDTTPDDPTKQTLPSQLPYAQVNNTDNIIPLTPEALNPATNGSQPQQVPNTATGNDMVLKQAQNTALNQPASPLTGLLTYQTANYLQDPNLGFNYDKYNNSQLEAYDRQQSQAMEAARQKLGDTSQSGELQNEFLKNQMNVASGRQDLQAKNDYAAQSAKQANLVSALGQGRATQAGNDTSTTSAIGNLATVRGMAEGERAQTTGFQDNVALTNLGFDHATQLAAQQNGYDLTKLNAQFGNDMAKLVATQDWTGAQAQLDRQQQLALQSNDVNAKAAAQEAQNRYDWTKAISTQSWQEGQAALDRQMQTALQSNDIRAKQQAQESQNEFDLAKLNKTQDWQSAQAKIAQDFELAKQNNDINATATNIQKQIDLDKWKQDNGQTFTASQNAINNALQLSLKNMDIQGQSDLLKLKGSIDKGMLVATNDFQSVQNELDRELKTAIQNNDSATQIQVTTLKGQIDAAAQKNSQDFTSAQNLAARNWQTGERLSEEDFNKATQALDIQAKAALAANDIDGQKAIETMKENTQLKMQTQDMDQQTKMAYLNQKLAEATANNDVGRQEQILGFKHTQDIETMQAQLGVDETKMRIQTEMDAYLKQGDYANARALQEAQLSFQSQENSKDRAIQQQSEDLKKMGFDYDAVQAAVANGQIDPQAAADLLKEATKDLGITIQTPDPMQDLKAAKKQYTLIQYQYSLSHPDTANFDNAGNFVGLKDSALSDFNDFTNKATSTDIANQDSSPAELAVNIVTNTNNWVGADKPDSKLHEAYQKLLDSSASWTTNGSVKDGDLYKFQVAIPGNGTTFKKDGKLYVATSGIQVQKRDWAPNIQYFTAIDAATGQETQIMP